MDKYVNTDIGIYHIESVCDWKDTDGHKLYRCKCNVCNGVYIRRISELKSCKQCRHLYTYWKHKRLGKIFSSMMSRCYDITDKAFRWYGAKGIGIDRDWLDNPSLFEDWAFKNGYDDNLTIDRIDATKNYCPDNCQWIPLKENTCKAGKVNWITVEGVTLTGKQWAEKLQVGVNTINRIVKRYGLDKTIELISKILKEPIETKNIKPGQSLLVVYDIQK